MSRTFDELIAEIDSGQVNAALSKEVRDLMAALSERAGEVGSARGEMTLKLKFACANNGRVEITVDTTIKRPGPPRAEETRWTGPNGELFVADPRQIGLPLKVPGMRAERAPPKTPQGDGTDKNGNGG